MTDASDSDAFPLSDWFDITRRIPKDDRETAEAQMRLYALKDGEDPCGRETNKAVGDLRAAIKNHNARFPNPGNKAPDPNSKRSRGRRERAAASF